MEESDKKTSDNSITSANKRQRELSSDEETLSVKKSRNSTDDEVPISSSILSDLETNDTENNLRKEIIQNANLVNNQENISSPTNNLQKDLHHTEIEETTDTTQQSVLNENTHVDVMKSRTKGTEVVDGLELSVECASDKEESSSESDEDYNSKPRVKTIIVKAKSDESENDDTDNDIENNDNEEDETKQTSSDNETSASDNESDNNNADKSKDNKKRKRDSTNPKNEKRVEFLRKCLRIAGISARSYQKSLSECKTHAAKMRHLKSLLEKNGISGRPTLKKCQKAKMRNERLQEVSELDKSNIISEGRLTRSQSVRDPKNTMSSESRNTYKRIKIIDSDSE